MTETMLMHKERLEHTQNHIHVGLSAPCEMISSAVLNGGVVHADHLVNLRVAKNTTATQEPEEHIAQYCAAAGWQGTVVGMMTAASMDSFRMGQECVQGIQICVLVTAGLSNPRRAGDRAECRVMAAQSEVTGTINIIALTSAVLTGAAMAEALMIVTEAKSAAMQEAGVMSPISNKIATGTGTDSVAVVSGHGPETVRYTGKHVLFGETLGRMVIDAVTSSISSQAKG
jgi:adenosylcobinamide hydrolase